MVEGVQVNQAGETCLEVARINRFPVGPKRDPVCFRLDEIAINAK